MRDLSNLYARKLSVIEFLGSCKFMSAKGDFTDSSRKPSFLNDKYLLRSVPTWVTLSNNYTAGNFVLLLLVPANILYTF